jgi:hypothetical protein
MIGTQAQRDKGTKLKRLYSVPLCLCHFVPAYFKGVRKCSMKR